MAQILFITAEDIKKRSPMGGNVDTDKYLQSVAAAQSTELLPILGSDLMDRIKLEIETVITPEITILLDDYIKDFLVNATVSLYALTANYQLTNGGISTYRPDNGNVVSTDEVIRLTNQMDQYRNHYGQLLIKFLSDNRGDYPEWKGSSTNSNFHGWQIGYVGNCNGLSDENYWEI